MRLIMGLITLTLLLSRSGLCFPRVYRKKRKEEKWDELLIITIVCINGEGFEIRREIRKRNYR